MVFVKFSYIGLDRWFLFLNWNMKVFFYVAFHQNWNTSILEIVISDYEAMQSSCLITICNFTRFFLTILLIKKYFLVVKEIYFRFKKIPMILMGFLREFTSFLTPWWALKRCFEMPKYSKMNKISWMRIFTSIFK